MSDQSADFVSLRRNPLFLMLLTMATGLGPFAMQMFVPALPFFREEFGVSVAVATLSISISLVTIGITTLVWGPLSDRYGRKIWLLTGYVMAAIGSVLGGWATSMETLILARMLQAAGSAAGMVLARAIIMDVYGREGATKAMAWLAFAMIIAPIIGQGVGALLLTQYVWRVNLFVVSAVSTVLLFWTLLGFGETNLRRQSDTGWQGLFQSFATLLRLREYRMYFNLGAMGMASFFCFLSLGAEFTRNQLGQDDPLVFGRYFIANAMAMMAGSVLAAKLANRLAGHLLILAGAVLAAIGYGLPLVTVGIWGWSPMTVFLPMMIAMVGGGLTAPNIMAGATGVVPERAGAASGLLGFGQMTLGAITAQIVALLLPTSIWFFWLGSGGMALLTLLLALHYHRKLFAGP